MRNLFRAGAVGGAAFALLLAAPALAHAEDAKPAITCDVDDNVSASVVFHGVAKFAEFCHGPAGSTITAVALAEVADGVKARIAEDKLSVAFDVDFMDPGVEYTAKVTVTDGTERATFVWAALMDLRGTPDVTFTPGADGKATGDLSRNDYREDFTYTVHTGPRHGTLKLNADGTFVYTGDKGSTGDQFSYKVAWTTKYHGVRYEVRTARITAAPAPTTSPSPSASSSAKPSPGKSTASKSPASRSPEPKKKDKLAETGSPVPVIAGTGAGALALGGAGLWLARRRRDS